MSQFVGRVEMDGTYQQQCLINIIILVPTTALMALAIAIIMDTETSGRKL